MTNNVEYFFIHSFAIFFNVFGETPKSFPIFAGLFLIIDCQYIMNTSLS